MPVKKIKKLHSLLDAAHRLSHTFCFLLKPILIFLELLNLLLVCKKLSWGFLAFTSDAVHGFILRKRIGFPISVNRYLYLNLSIYRFSERYLYVGSTVCPMKPECEMKGFLSLLLLWIIHEKKMTGSGIANEISARKGSRPSPGTIYPALKELKQKGLVSCDKGKAYSITKKGRRELSALLKSFF